MIDWTRVEELRDEIGPEDFDEVAELFLMEVEDTLSRLADAVDDPAQMQSLLHFLKGSALNLGFRDVCSVCSKGETDAAHGVLSVDTVALKQLYTDSRTAFKAGFAKRFAA